jgi:site-specific DNA-methyltransferase (adenine-specific)
MSAIIKEERIGGQRLILGDCLEVMKELGAFDAVVTDPPYGIGYKPFDKMWNGQRKKVKAIEGDDAKFDPLPFIDFPNVILWGANHYSDRLPIGNQLIWDKRTKKHLDAMFGDPCEVAWMKSSGRSKTHIIRLQHGGVVNSDSVQGNNAARFHPTQKPIAAMEWCIGFLPKDTQTILDPFMGSGTTLVACQRMGRNGTGIELDPDYFQIACERVDEATRQGDMFTPQIKPKPIENHDIFGGDAA